MNTGPGTGRETPSSQLVIIPAGAKPGAGSAAVYSWEAWGTEPTPDLVDALGSVGHSPAATAAWLHAVADVDTDVLSTAVDETTLEFVMNGHRPGDGADRARPDAVRGSPQF